MGKKRKYIIRILLLVWLVFFITDFSLAKARKSPVFSVPIILYKDGGSAEYYGLGYKVIKYVKLTAEKGPEIIRVDLGTWVMKYSHSEID